MPKSKELRQALEDYQVLERILSRAKERAKADPAKFSSQVGLTGQIGTNRDFFRELFDRLQTKVDELCLLDIVAVFENIIFQRIHNALGDARTILGDAYPRELQAFSIAAKNFVRENETIRYLGDAEDKILRGGISHKLMKDLKYAVDERNRIVHGKRFGEPPATPKPLEDVVDILEQVLRKHNLL